ncbi:hypothetical protein BOX15_Mlig015885g1 [Macrostomum lignano]|uniref:[histone H3]-trimethyl-L-lysine(4) demethylase n=1 Tax=Macrostomum lignano TaxID=282301 RepID=A0A267FGP4_9PLAT|nr:hypothetical protein BOX15_Mlig015885g1 [Macrostomum lignano]
MEPEFKFTPPPLAPIFEPTAEEFGNFYEYLRDIYPIVVKTGVCKIRPPKGWKPPFCIDIDTFEFTPRIQRLNELEATSRVKLNFLDQLARFWELQGARLRVPCVDKRHVDLHRLSQAVQRLGGYDSVCSGKRWQQVAELTGYPASSRCAPAQLRQHYERIVRPYDIFKAGVSTDVGLLRAKSIERQQSSHGGVGGSGGGAGGPPTRRYGARGGLVRYPSASSSTAAADESGGGLDDAGIDYNRSKELRRLQYFGPGPKAAVPQAALPPEQSAPVVEPTRMEVKSKREGTAGWLDSLVCRVCSTSAQEELLLICESCQAPFHTYCLFPQLPDVPKGEWRCPGCVAKSFDRPSAEYGFEQSRKQYTLADFGAMADQFKAGHFHKSLHCISYSEVESEFWRLLQALNEPISVEYGADLHSSSAGSGFPTANRRPRLFDSRDEAAKWDAYLADEWNLNNLPLNEQGFLRFLHQDINGMVIPWCYVGMVFSAFCWHIEDHWSYSINYLHWGEPKTWYGVPAHDAEGLERVMRAEAGELFDASPDLLHHITTIMNPNQLMSAGVSVYRIDQEAGDFVITCPRAYHAGFNQGFNFAEAVNFCPSDWLPVGRQCVDHYASIGRHCVFSHEELVCAAAIAAVQKPACIKESQLPELLFELQIVVDREERELQVLAALSVPSDSSKSDGTNGGKFDSNERGFERFEVLPDDDRQCSVCSTTLYVSAIVCQCLPRRLLCLSHSDQLCPKCTSHLLYRHTVPELRKLVASLSDRTTGLEQWRRESTDLLARMRRARQASGDSKCSTMTTRPTREQLAELCNRARKQLGVPRSCPILAELRSALALADQAASIVQVLLKPPRAESGKSGSGGNNKTAANADKKRVPYASFQAFRSKLAGLACTVDGQSEFESICVKVDAWLARCHKLLVKSESAAGSNPTETDSDAEAVEEAEALLAESAQLPVSLDELPKLREIAVRLNWRREVGSLIRGSSRCSMARIEELNSCQPPASAVGQQLLSKFHALYDRALQITYGVKILLQVTSTDRGSEDFDNTEAILMIEQARRLPIDIDLVDRLALLAESVDDWQVAATPPAGGFNGLAEVERLVQTGRSLGVRLKKLASLESQTELARAWLRQAGDAFLRPADAASAGDTALDIEMALLAAVLPVGADPQKFASSEAEEAQLLYNTATAAELRQIAAYSAADSAVVVERSKRPGMDTLLALLVANRGFQIRLAASRAIHLLSERAMAWRQRVHDTLLSTVELRAALLLVARALHFRLPHKLMWQLRSRLGESADAELAGVSARRPRKSLLFPRAPLEADTDTTGGEFDSVDDIDETGRRRRVDPAAAAARVSGLRLSVETHSQLNSLLAEGRLLEVGMEETDWLRLMLRSATASAAFVAASASTSSASVAAASAAADASSAASPAGGKRARLLDA